MPEQTTNSNPCLLICTTRRPSPVPFFDFVRNEEEEEESSEDRPNSSETEMDLSLTYELIYNAIVCSESLWSK